MTYHFLIPLVGKSPKRHCKIAFSFLKFITLMFLFVLLFTCIIERVVYSKPLLYYWQRIHVFMA